MSSLRPPSQGKEKRGFLLGALGPFDDCLPPALQGGDCRKKGAPFSPNGPNEKERRTAKF